MQLEDTVCSDAAKRCASPYFAPTVTLTVLPQRNGHQYDAGQASTAADVQKTQVQAALAALRRPSGPGLSPLVKTPSWRRTPWSRRESLPSAMHAHTHCIYQQIVTHVHFESTALAFCTLNKENTVERLIFASPSFPTSTHITVYTSLQPNCTCRLTSTYQAAFPPHRRCPPRASPRPKTDRFCRSHKNSTS